MGLFSKPSSPAVPAEVLGQHAVAGLDVRCRGAPHHPKGLNVFGVSRVDELGSTEQAATAARSHIDDVAKPHGAGIEWCVALQDLSYKLRSRNLKTFRHESGGSDRHIVLDVLDELDRGKEKTTVGHDELLANLAIAAVEDASDFLELVQRFSFEVPHSASRDV